LKIETVNNDVLLGWYNYHDPSVNFDEKSYDTLQKI